jgi:hypothetical protein
MGKHNYGLEHKRLADINALFKKHGIWFKATAIQPTIGDGSCGYHALRRYFDAIPGHPYANLTIAECRFLAARLMRADVAAQEQAVAVETITSTRSVVKFWAIMATGDGLTG